MENKSWLQRIILDSYQLTSNKKDKNIANSVWFICTITTMWGDNL